MRRTTFGYLLVCALGVVAYSLFPNVPAKDIGYDLFGALAAVAILAGVRRNGETRRFSWLILAASRLLFAVGDAAFTTYARLAPGAAGGATARGRRWHAARAIVAPMFRSLVERAAAENGR